MRERGDNVVIKSVTLDDKFEPKRYWLDIINNDKNNFINLCMINSYGESLSVNISKDDVEKLILVLR